MMYCYFYSSDLGRFTWGVTSMPPDWMRWKSNESHWLVPGTCHE